jgi:hypothetical protein
MSTWWLYAFTANTKPRFGFCQLNNAFQATILVNTPVPPIAIFCTRDFYAIATGAGITPWMHPKDYDDKELTTRRAQLDLPGQYLAMLYNVQSKESQ